MQNIEIIIYNALLCSIKKEIEIDKWKRQYQYRYNDALIELKGSALTITLHCVLVMHFPVTPLQQTNAKTEEEMVIKMLNNNKWGK